MRRGKDAIANYTHFQLIFNCFLCPRSVHSPIVQRPYNCTERGPVMKCLFSWNRCRCLDLYTSKLWVAQLSWISIGNPLIGPSRMQCSESRNATIRTNWFLFNCAHMNLIHRNAVGLRQPEIRIVQPRSHSKWAASCAIIMIVFNSCVCFLALLCVHRLLFSVRTKRFHCSISCSTVIINQTIGRLHHKSKTVLRLDVLRCANWISRCSGMLFTVLIIASSGWITDSYNDTRWFVWLTKQQNVACNVWMMWAPSHL